MKPYIGVPHWEDEYEHRIRSVQSLMTFYDDVQSCELTCPICNHVFNNRKRQDTYPTRFCPQCQTVYDMRSTERNAIEIIWIDENKEITYILRKEIIFNW